VELPSYETEVFITILKDPAAVTYSESNPLSIAAPYFNVILAFTPGISKRSLEVFCLSICNCLIKSALKFYLWESWRGGEKGPELKCLKLCAMKIECRGDCAFTIRGGWRGKGVGWGGSLGVSSELPTRYWFLGRIFRNTKQVRDLVCLFLSYWRAPQCIQKM